MFFGREEVLQKIYNNLRGIYQDNVLVLRGQRRTGKSSIIYQILNQKEVDFMRHYSTVLIDMQGLKSARTSRLCGKIYDKIYTVLSNKHKSFSINIDLPFNDSPIENLDDFFDYLYSHYPDDKILLLFDEFEGLIESIRDGRVDPTFLDSLRSWMQHKENLSFIIVGADQLRTMLKDYSSILFNIAQFISIGHLNEAEAIDLIKIPLKNKISFDDVSISRILDLTGRNAYYIQLVCNALVDRMNQVFRNKVTLVDIEKTIIEKITVFGNYFEHLWERSYNEERLVLIIITDRIDKTGDMVTIDEIIKAIKSFDKGKIDDRKVIEALNNHEDRDILCHEESGSTKYYKFLIDLFRIRIKESTNISDFIGS